MPIELPLTWQEIHTTAKHLSTALRGKGPQAGTWDKLIAVTRGGLVPACLIARDLDIRTIETISIASYDHQAQGSVNVLKAAADCGDGTGCLVIDDLADTGNTFRAIRKILPKATFACLYVKPEGNPSADYYVTEYSQDTWIYFPWEDQDFPASILATHGSHLPK